MGQSTEGETMRRHYTLEGRPCEDCGRSYSTLAYFWVNAMPYWLCPECIKAYRRSLLQPCPHWRRPIGTRARCPLNGQPYHPAYGRGGQ